MKINLPHRVAERKSKCWFAQLYPTLWISWTIAHQGPLVHRVLQARILEWVAVPFSEGYSPPRDRTWVSWIAGRLFTIWTKLVLVKVKHFTWLLTSPCAWHTVSPNKLKHLSLEQRMVYCQATQWDRWLMLWKAFAPWRVSAKYFLKDKWERGRVKGYAISLCTMLWQSGRFIPIPKKGNAKECSNYCSFALISQASQVLLKILQESQVSTIHQPWASRCSSWI